MVNLQSIISAHEKITLFYWFAVVFKRLRKFHRNLVREPNASTLQKRCGTGLLSNKKDSISDWVDFTGSIDGFDYEPGYSYTLEVEKATASNDSNIPKYALKKSLKRKKCQIPNKK